MLFLDIFLNFQNTFKKPAASVKREFLGISRKATFWNIIIYVIARQSCKFRNLFCCFIKKWLQATFAVDSVFNIVIVNTLGSSNC